MGGCGLETWLAFIGNNGREGVINKGGPIASHKIVSMDCVKPLHNFSVLFPPSVLPDYWEDYLVAVEDYIYQFCKVSVI